MLAGEQFVSQRNSVRLDANQQNRGMQRDTVGGFVGMRMSKNASVVRELRLPSAALAFLALWWCIVGIVAWVVSAMIQVGVWPGSSVAFLAVITASINALIRRSSVENLEPFLQQIAWQRIRWFVAWTSSVNWFGCIILTSGSVDETLPAFFIICAAEAWLWPLCRKDFAELALSESGSLSSSCAGDTEVAAEDNEGLPDCSLVETDIRSDSPVVAEGGACPKELKNTELERRVLGSDPLNGNGEADCGEDGLQAVRRQTDSIDSEGKRIITGEVLVRLQPGQKVESIVISFQPPFLKPPEVELECESDSVTATLVNCTPRGMRVTAKRRSVEPTEFLLAWCAIEACSEAVVDTSQSEPMRLP